MSPVGAAFCWMSPRVNAEMAFPRFLWSALSLSRSSQLESIAAKPTKPSGQSPTKNFATQACRPKSMHYPKEPLHAIRTIFIQEMVANFRGYGRVFTMGCSSGIDLGGRGELPRADRLLNSPNPYTRIPLGKDPAVAIVELVNEDSHFFWTFGKKNSNRSRASKELTANER